MTKWNFTSLPLEKKMRIYKIFKETENRGFMSKDRGKKVSYDERTLLHDKEVKELLLMHNEFKLSPYDYCGCDGDYGFVNFFKKFYYEKRNETEVVKTLLEILK